MKRAIVIAILGAVLAFAPSVTLASPVYRLSQAQAFSILHVSCGGIQQSVTIISQDDQTTVGNDHLSTRCGLSGRGGGYKVHLYSGDVVVTWDTATGAVLSY